MRLVLLVCQQPGKRQKAFSTLFDIEQDEKTKKKKKKKKKQREYEKDLNYFLGLNLKVVI